MLGVCPSPLFAAKAVIEVKRTGSKAEREGLAEQLKKRQNLLPVPQMDFVLGIIVNDNDDPQPLFNNERRPAPNWLEEHWLHSAGAAPVTRILCNNKPDTSGIMAFIYFLAQVAAHEKRLAASVTAT